MLNLVLYQPDIPQNLGAMLRLSACMGATVHVIEPCGFPMNDAKLRRAGMDYVQQAKYLTHVNWESFLRHRQKNPGRLILLETDGAKRYSDVMYQQTDYIVLGRESAGTPRELYALMEETIFIPMQQGARSLNVAMAAGMLTAEACRQFEWKFA